MARNEGGRFLKSALSAWTSFADLTIVLDDHSTDNTADLARAAGALVLEAPQGTAWGNEAGHRQALFMAALEHTPDDGWILILDADMVPGRNPRPLMSGDCNAWAFPLYDLWDRRGTRFYYREDAFWQGHLNPRIWMIRKPHPSDWVWSDRGIHCGHLPANFHITHQLGIAPYDYGLLHFAYIDDELRAEKARQYLSTSDKLRLYEQNHARSITDIQPRLIPLDFEPEYILSKPYIDREAA